MKPADVPIRYLGTAGTHLIQEPVLGPEQQYASQPSKNDASRIIKKAESPPSEIAPENIKDATTSPTPMESIDEPAVDDSQ